MVMRKREEIKKTVETLWVGNYSQEYLIKSFSEIMIDVLLDIRDLLVNQNNNGKSK